LIVQFDHRPNSKSAGSLAKLTDAISSGFNRQVGALMICDDAPETKLHTSQTTFVIAFADRLGGSGKIDVSGVKGQIQPVE